MTAPWHGVYPAMTTPFLEDESLDLDSYKRQIDWLIRAGVHGLIPLGSLGENMAMTATEKRKVAETAVQAAAGRVPVVAGVCESSTAEARRFATDFAAMGGSGIMLLPGVPYRSDAAETIWHFRSVADAAQFPVMIYNNPIVYGVDVSLDMLEELSRSENITHIKESSDDVRRVASIVRTYGERFSVFIGVDNLALEALLNGAAGWVAGLVDAFPEETLAVYNLARNGRYGEAQAVYAWFRPLLDLDVSTKLVQNIKLVQAKVGIGTEYVRAPRLPLRGVERTQVEAIIDEALQHRPQRSGNSQERTATG